jgi:hypothetical protein
VGIKGALGLSRCESKRFGERAWKLPVSGQRESSNGHSAFNKRTTRWNSTRLVHE